jgi:splicing factor 3B subunit 2
VYYEGKEMENKLATRSPGVLSQQLREALGMPPGAPPPWLLNMQRIGPPPGISIK